MRARRMPPCRSCLTARLFLSVISFKNSKILRRKCLLRYLSFQIGRSINQSINHWSVQLLLRMYVAWFAATFFSEPIGQRLSRWKQSENRRIPQPSCTVCLSFFTIAVLRFWFFSQIIFLFLCRTEWTSAMQPASALVQNPGRAEAARTSPWYNSIISFLTSLSITISWNWMDCGIFQFLTVNFCFIARLDRLIDWLIDRWNDFLLASDCLIDWLMVVVIDELIDWLIDRLIDWLIDSSIDWLIDCLIYLNVIRFTLLEVLTVSRFDSARWGVAGKMCLCH